MQVKTFFYTAGEEVVGENYGLHPTLPSNLQGRMQVKTYLHNISGEFDSQSNQTDINKSPWILSHTMHGVVLYNHYSILILALCSNP